MNDFSLVRHLLRKDLRHQRVWLLVIWAYALLMPWTPGLYEIHNGMQYQDYYLLPLYAVTLIAAIRMLQLDPPGRTIHFLATRPVAWPGLLAGKVLFLGLFLFLPLLLSKLETVYLLGVSFNPWDVALFTVETLIFTAALFAVVALPAFFLRNLLAVLLILIVGTALFGLVSVLFFNHVRAVFAGPYYAGEDPQLAACRWLMFELGLALTALAVAVFYYGKRSMFESFGLLSAGLILSGILLFYWPIKLDEVISGRAFAKVPEPLRDQLHFTIRSGSFDNNQVWKDHTDIQSVSAEVDLDGLAPPYDAVETDFHAKAPDFGLSSSYDWGVANATGIGSNLLAGRASEASAAKIIAGFPPPTLSHWNDYSFAFFAYPLGLTSHDFKWYGKTIQGEITLEIRRTFIARTVPAQPKMSFDRPRRHYEMEIPRMFAQSGTYSHQGDPSVMVSMTTKSVPLVLRGDYAAGAMNLSWLVVNRNRKEYLVPNDHGFAGFPSGPVFYGIQRNVFQLLRPGQTEINRPPAELIPHDWIDTAEIDVFASEPCGRISFPYELNGR